MNGNHVFEMEYKRKRKTYKKDILDMTRKQPFEVKTLIVEYIF